MKFKSFSPILCALLAILLCLPTVALASPSSINNHWASAELDKWKQQDFISDTSEPNKAMTRLEVITIVNKVFNLTIISDLLFSDLEKNSEASKQVNIAATAGYIKGYGDGSFHPDQAVTREEVAVILQRVFQLVGQTYGLDKLIDSDKLKNWSIAAVGALLHDQYIKGYPDQTFKPEKSVTLAEFITMLNNIAPIIITKPGVYSNLTEKNIIIASPDVTIINSDLTGNIYVTGAAAKGNITIENTNTLGTLFSYIAGTFITLKSSTIGNQVLLQPQVTAPSVPEETATPSTVPESTPSPTKKPTPTPTATPNPTATSEPTATPKPTVTPEPTATPVPPTFQEVSIHDPSIIKSKEGEYYVFGSHIEAAKSSDLMSWDRFTNGYATSNNQLFGNLSDNLKESFAWAGENDADNLGGFSVWAPDIMWVDEYDNRDGTKGAYLMYYSVSSTAIRSAIGVAASQNIEGPYQYVETIMYSGFTNKEDYDAKSVINKHWENTNLAKLIENDIIGDVNSSWFKGDGSYNNSTYPNAIDANLYRDTEGKLWMSYGSWSGGIFALEIDPATGSAKYPGTDSTTSDGRIVDRYFGTKIAGGYGKSGEGPYVEYDEQSEYFFLFVTYGWLGIDGEYNMRVFRSKSPNGPFVDANGDSAVLTATSVHDSIGNKIMGHYNFERNIGEQGSGSGIQYVSPGHNSVYIDDETGERFVVFHTRFSQQVDGFELRTHQLVMTEDNWLIATPYRYAGESLQAVTESDIVGDYKYINHEQDSSKTVHTSTYITLNVDKSITGAITGTWELIHDYTVRLTVNGSVYTGAFIEQWDSASQAYVMAFTAMNNEGKSIWGSQLRGTNNLAQDILDDITVTPTSNIIANLILPAKATRNIAVSWSSSNSAVISDNGLVTRPTSDDDTAVTLTASYVVDGETYTKAIDVTVKPTEASLLTAKYSFEDNLIDSQNVSKQGTVVGGKITDIGKGYMNYGSGFFGKAAYFDGGSGVVLPSDLINSDTYSVSLWLKPEQLTSFTTAFFAGEDANHWISLLPKGNAIDNTMLWYHQEAPVAWFDARTNTNIALNDWSHVAFTVEEGYLRIYINGKLLHSSQSLPDLFSSDADNIFSLAVNYWDTPFKGYIDELEVYTGVLSQQEINAMLTSDSKVTTIQLAVSEKIISLEQTFTPKNITVSPTVANNKQLKWSTADSSIATVNSVTGTVTGVSIGTTTITATSTDGGNVSTSYELHVVEGEIAHFNFNENMNNIAVTGSQSATYIGNRININTTDTPVFDNGQGIVLDGSHGVLLPNYYFNDQTYSIRFNVKMNTLDRYSALFFAFHKNDQWLSFVPGGADHTNGNAFLWANNTGASGTADWFDGSTDQKFSTTEWVQVTITVNNGTASIYYGNTLVKSFNNFKNLFTSDTTTVALGVNYWDAPAKGIVDDLKIFDYALSAEQVSALEQ
ncbi:LamG-like jellyroll fold domain-containing protein [Paenibacillus endoradicis]|uniref:LamG-like jellyroll fold domain-containing protein n=1 Tax=Paenibacillus endoradicis TaxID=2972487 RepID=UPI002159ADC7|nr:LamG-like jellyroll fold domain-containing protein [Paenibacillus endoradicis]MCR8657358.1 S-layer homology domain-containing protein [Paenibacillus endoradicis]